MAITADTVARTGRASTTSNVIAEVSFGGRTLVLSEPLIRVSVFLGAFSGHVLHRRADDRRHLPPEFADDVGPEIRQVLAVRYAYHVERRDAPGADDRRSDAMSESPLAVQMRLLRTPRGARRRRRAVAGRHGGSSGPIVTVELLIAIAHSGGYVAAALDQDDRDGRRVVRLPRPAPPGPAGAAQPRHRPSSRRVRHGGIGRAIKLHQRTVGDSARARVDHLDVRSAGASQRLVQHRRPRRRRRRVPPVVLRRRCPMPSTPATTPTGCSWSRGICHATLPATPRDGGDRDVEPDG